jgi:nucleotide-binding universal stress UspA family protein
MRSDAAIMVGVVGGTLDRMVLGWAAEEAVARHAELLVCHVRERREPSLRTGEPEPAGSAEVLVREAANTAHSWFPDLAIATAVGHDRVAAALIRASVDARMLVVGARADDGGEEGSTDLRLGSVAEQVAANARCPVAVIRAPSAPDLVDVVVGVDGSSHSDLTLRLAAAEARRFGGRLIVVHAYRLPAPAEYGPNAGVDEPHHRAAAEALLEQTLDQLGPDRGALKIETRAVHDGATPALLDAAAAAAAVVVVGAPGSGGLGRLRIGSVSQHLLRHAPCPVLIAR